MYKSRKSLDYRADIDGLRAIAVLSVVFYHAGLGFPGGYVGVDVFFVISGYLITALILKDLERGSFSMANFWERRICRIFPALAVMVAVTCVAGWFLLLPEDLAKLGASVIAQSLLVSNFYFWRTTNYFGGANEEKPLLHTWSLAVEEQFYLIFPIALMAIWAFFNYRLKKRDERNLTTIEHGGRCEKEQPKVGPKGEGVGTSESKDTESTEVKAGACLAGQAGAAFSNPSASQLARDSENTSLIRSADTPSSLPATSYPSLVTSPIGDNRRWALFWIFASVVLVSFGLSTWGVKSQPFATFFLLPTRAWELLLGSMLAVLPASVVFRTSALREVLCLVGLAGIFLPVFFYDEQTPFPGLAALPPCLGTAALIWANTPARGDNRPGLIAKALSWQPVVFIGLISYSLYLWHWPLISFGKYLGIAPKEPIGKVLLFASILLISIASWKFVEQPFRSRRSISKRRTVFALAFTSSLIILGIGSFFAASGGYQNRFGEEAREVFAKLEQDKKNWESFGLDLPEIKDPGKIQLSKLPRWGSPSENAERFLVWGDSHARMPICAIHEEMSRRGVSGFAVIHHSTPPLVGFDHKMGLGLPKEIGSIIAKRVLTLVSEQKIKYVLLCGYWSIYQDAIGEPKLVEALKNTIKQLQVGGAKVYLMADWPDQDLDPLRLAILQNTGIPLQWFPPPRTKAQHEKKNSAIIKMALQGSDFMIIDPADDFLEPDGKNFKIWHDGWPVYSDTQHIGFYATKVLLKKTLSNLP